MKKLRDTMEFRDAGKLYLPREALVDVYVNNQNNWFGRGARKIVQGIVTKENKRTVRVRLLDNNRVVKRKRDRDFPRSKTDLITLP